MTNLNNQSSPSLSKAKEYIYTIDFSRIVSKLVNHSGWLAEDAYETCELYRNFLFLNKKYGDAYESMPPSEDIDEFWHSHILDTAAYTKDCNAIYGKVLEHYPYLGIDGKTDITYLNKAFELTQKLHYIEFRKYINPTRSKYPKIIYFLMKKFVSCYQSPWQQAS